MVTGNSVWHLVMQSDALSKGVLAALLCMSIGMWTVFMGKVWVLYRKKRDMKDVLAQIQRSHTVSELTVMGHQKVNSLPGDFLLYIIKHASQLREYVREHSQNGSKNEMRNHLEMMVDQEIDSIIVQEEQYTPLLSTCAVISPLLGLLGTVWGLIHSFINISQTQVADIATVAPGIAEALITTLAGLIVAIPAVVMVNYVTSQIVYLEQQLVRLSDHVINIVEWSMENRVNKEDVCVDLPVGEQNELQQ